MNATLSNTRCEMSPETPQSARRPVRPKADIYETNDAWLLVLDLPGTDEHGTDISLEKHVLTIKADAEDFIPDGFDRVHTEFLPRRYERSFRLPEATDITEIAASVKNGVLRLTLPKSTEARPQQIVVRAG